MHLAPQPPWGITCITTVEGVACSCTIVDLLGQFPNSDPPRNQQVPKPELHHPLFLFLPRGPSPPDSSTKKPPPWCLRGLRTRANQTLLLSNPFLSLNRPRVFAPGAPSPSGPPKKKAPPPPVVIDMPQGGQHMGQIRTPKDSAYTTRSSEKSSGERTPEGRRRSFERHELAQSSSAGTPTGGPTNTRSLST